MGFCTDEQYETFLRQVPQFERLLVDDGISLTKFWFSVTPGEQHTRFAIRQIDPVRQWKLSPTDIALLDKWDAYTAAKVAMFQRTHTPEAPWTVIRSNDKKRARLEAMRSLLAGDRLRPQGSRCRRASGSVDRRRARGHAGNWARATIAHSLTPITARSGREDLASAGSDTHPVWRDRPRN